MANSPPENKVEAFTPFIGRKAELERLLKLFQMPTTRLVTLLGEGGIGKTRLALELVGRLEGGGPHGSLFVPLAQVSSADELLPALADKLGVHLPPGGDLKQAVLEHLIGRNILMVLDNFEHMQTGALLVRDLLGASGNLKVLATSREKLGLEVETLYRLGGLELPPVEEMQSAQAYDSTQLFLQKARQVRPDFSLNEGNIQAVIRICRMLNGNPLGILLAAAWVEYFSPEEIADQIVTDLTFMSSRVRDGEPRHASLRAVFTSSFNRLDERARTVFSRLSCFRGGFDLAAAEVVAGADLSTLLTLVDKSLLYRDPGSRRYDLHELLRQYASEMLKESGDLEAVLSVHAHYYLAFVDKQTEPLTSAHQNQALDAIQSDYDNIRQAFTWAVGKKDFASLHLVIPDIYAYIDHRSRFYEGAALFHQACQDLAPRDSEAPNPTYALVLLSWYDMRNYHERFKSHDEIRAMAQACLDRARSLDDKVGIAAALVLLGAIHEHEQEFEAAIPHYEEAMQTAPMLDDAYWVNMRIGLCHLSARQYPEAIRSFQVSLERGRTTGEQVKTGWSLVNIGDALFFQGKLAEARASLEQAVDFFTQVDTQFGLLWSHMSLGRLESALGDLDRAREHLGTASRLAHQLHSLNWIEKTGALLKELESRSPARSHPALELAPEGFSPRELEVLQLLKSDLSGPEIADHLVVSLNTVRFHIKNIYQKLGVNRRLEAIQRAKELGL
jgi:predicted ATPase/DNA-binding CsgD family transcriptional regulator